MHHENDNDGIISSCTGEWRNKLNHSLYWFMAYIDIDATNNGNQDYRATQNTKEDADIAIV